MKLAGKHAVVTGSSQGLGKSIASMFAREGCDVLMCARSEADLLAAREEISASARTKVVAVVADVAVGAGVKTLVRAAEESFDGIDILVCNAGVYGPKGAIDELDWESWVQAIQINLLGTVLCCRLFLPLLRRAVHGKIILLSGGGATKPMPFLSAYAASKAAVVRFGETIAQELQPAGIDVNSVAPGALNTRMLQEVIAAGPEKVGKAYYEAALKQEATGGVPLDVAAGLCVYLASDESNGITGKLLSAVWDPWRDLQSHREDLDTSDVYTLRRIVPGERGFRWG